MNSQDSLTEKEKLDEQLAPEETTQQTNSGTTAPIEVETTENSETTTETAPETEAASAEPAPVEVEAAVKESVEVEKTETVEAPVDEKPTETSEAPETDVSEKKEEAEPEEVVADKTEEVSEEKPEAGEEKIDLGTLSKQELIDHLAQLIQKEVAGIREEADQIKQLFYKKSKAETDAERAGFIADGGIETEFIPSAPKLEEEFKTLFDEYRAKRAKEQQELEQERENNLLRKNHIIEQIKQLVESKEDVSANISVFRQLQQEWQNTGPVPSAANNELWRSYNQHQEAFWDLIKINNELRDYDFRKNLEAKNKLIEKAEALDEEKDIVSAFRKLQTLHEKWRELGPVARDLREETWDRFKEASTVINRKHQSHFDEIRKIETRNLELKTELCEKIEAVDVSELKNYRAWNNATKKILNLQEEWRTIGFAPRKHNKKIYDRYRAACDKFFAAKSDFYKNMKQEMAENLKKKIELCEKAEAMKDNTDWKETSESLIALQKEWKTIGPVQKKHSDQIWNRFIEACDYFFEQRNKNASGRRGEELRNMEIKKEIIEKIKAFEKSDDASESLAGLRALAAEWSAVGHVPYREKDNMYKAYRAALDEKFDDLNIDISERRMESFRSNLKDMEGRGDHQLYRERDKLVRAYEHLKSEIATYENNISFLSISSTKGSGMLQEIQRKIDTLKEECALLEQKINLIDEQI